MLGRQLYRKGDFEGALREFMVAHALVPSSARLTYNIARVLERLGRVEDAIDFYEKYLTLAPGADDRAEVEGFVAGLTALLATQAPRPEPVKSQPPRPAPAKPEPEPAEPEPEPQVVASVEAGPDRTLMWVGAGVGAAGLGAGIVFTALALGANDDAQAAGDRDAAESKQADAELDEVLAWTGYAVALAGAGLAVTAYLLEPEEASAWRLNVGPGAASVEVRF